MYLIIKCCWGYQLSFIISYTTFLLLSKMYIHLIYPKCIFSEFSNLNIFKHIKKLQYLGTAECCFLCAFVGIYLYYHQNGEWAPNPLKCSSLIMNCESLAEFLMNTEVLATVFGSNQKIKLLWLQILSTIWSNHPCP